MGNIPSGALTRKDDDDDIWWTNGQRNATSENVSTKSLPETPDAGAERTLSDENKEKLNEFKLEMARKHEKRRQIIAEKRKEMMEMREEIARLREENEKLKNQPAAQNPSENHTQAEQFVEEIKRLREELAEKTKLLESSESIIEDNRRLRINVAEVQKELQRLNTQVLDFDKERKEYETHVVALKNVIAVSKQMLSIRENQLKELKQKVDTIEASLAGREMKILSQDLRSEYERQLQNIRNLRSLYEERQRADRREKEELSSVLKETKVELEKAQKKVGELVDRVSQLEEDNSKKYDEIQNLKSNLGLAKAESRQYQAELTVINQLFSEVLLGFQNSQDIDLDKLTKHLEEHHDLLKNIVVNEISSEVSSALPKVLLDLINDISDKNNTDVSDRDTPDKCDAKDDNKLETIIEESESQTPSNQEMNSPEEIVELLPKVWRVLIELLSHQKAPVNNMTNDDDGETENPCYKKVETPKGPSLVLSVSQTFLRLKDLILEKKSLEKEMSHLKHLNGHLENRLQDQEKRLELVSSELSKTWHVVGKLQKQHQLLHTQEKILRYELAQKRKLLTHLKEELEYSREMSQQAREKNSNSEKLWKQLRTEFASRRNTVPNDDYNNSVESGFSDERSSDDEPGYETDISECNLKTTNQDELETDFESKENEDSDSSMAEEIDMVVEAKPSLSTETICQILHSGNEEQQRVEECREYENKTSDAQKTEPVQSSEKTLLENFDNEQPSTSTETPKKTLEEVLAAREERFKKLEGQASQLVRQVTDTNNKSVIISNKLDNLHEVYGESSSNSQTGDNTGATSSNQE